MADIFDVLADGTRRDLLRRLRERGGEVSVGELVTELGISQPTVSKHLKVLRDHELVAVREEGQHRYYRLDARPLQELGTWLAPFTAPRAGVDVGGRVGRAAAETAHAARAALEAAQEKLQGARRRVTGRLPRGRRSS